MRNLLIIFLILSSSFCFSQKTDNRFSQEEAPQESSGFSQKSDVNSNNVDSSNAGDDDLPPNPSDPIPIDDYLPLLAITAVGIIIYTTQKKRNLIRK